MAHCNCRQNNLLLKMCGTSATVLYFLLITCHLFWLAAANIKIDVFPVQPEPNNCLFAKDSCSTSCLDSSKQCSLQASSDSVCLGLKRKGPVSNQTLVTGASLQAWEAAFSNLGECWPKLKQLLCELYAPRCVKNKYRRPPSRLLCKFSFKQCNMSFTQLFPSLAIDILDCDKYPTERVCFNETLQPDYEHYKQPDSQEQKRKCLHPLVATNSVAVQFAHKEFKGCDLKCLSPLYKDVEYTKMRLILSSFSIILVLMNTLIVVSFIVSWKRCVTVPRQTLFFVYLCFLLISCIWLTQVFPSAHFDIVCRRDGTLRTGEPPVNQGDSISCLAVFVLTQFASLSSQLSFLLFALGLHAKIYRFRRRHFRRLTRQSVVNAPNLERPINNGTGGNSTVAAEETASPTNTADGRANQQQQHHYQHSSTTTDNNVSLLSNNNNSSGGKARRDASCLIFPPATQWIVVIATPIIFLIVALSTNEIEGDPISGVCIVSRGNPLARLGLHTCPMLGLLLTAVVVLCNGYRTLRSLVPHLDRPNELIYWSKHVQRWGKGERIMFQSFLYSFGHRAMIFAAPVTLCCALYLAVDVYAFVSASSWREKIYDYVICQMRREFLQQSRSQSHQPLPACQVLDPPSYLPLLFQAVCHPVLNFAFYLWLPEPLLKGWRDLWRRALTVCRLRANPANVDSLGSQTLSEPASQHHQHQHHHRRQLSQQQSHFYQQLAYLFSDSEKARQQIIRRFQHRQTEFRNPAYYQQQQESQQQRQQQQQSSSSAAAAAAAAAVVVTRVGGGGGGGAGSERTSIGSCSLLSRPVSDTDIYDGQAASLPASTSGVVVAVNTAAAAGSTAGRAHRHSSLGRDSRRISGSGRRRRGGGSGGGVAMATGGHQHHRAGSAQQPPSEAIYQPGASGQSRVSAQSLLTYRSATSERRRQEFEHYLMHYIRPLEFILWQAYQEGFEDALNSGGGGGGDDNQNRPATATLNVDEAGAGAAAAESLEQAPTQQQQQQQQSRPSGSSTFSPKRLLQYNFGFNFPPGSPMMQQHYQQQTQPPQPHRQSPAPPQPRLESPQLPNPLHQQQQFIRRIQTSRPKAPPRYRQSDEFDSEDEECRTPPDYSHPATSAGFLPTGEEVDVEVEDPDDSSDTDDNVELVVEEDSDEFDSEAEVNSETGEVDQSADASNKPVDLATDPGAEEYMIPILPTNNSKDEEQYFLYDASQ